MSWEVPLADVAVPEDDIAAIADTYRSGWLSMGPETERLEAEFRAYSGAEHAIAVASGTAALHLICLAIELDRGDEVVVPSMTFVATVNAVRYTGATPVFADIAGVGAPWLSAAAAERAITPRTRAIMAMAYGGHAGEVEALRELADYHGIVLLEDAAHAVGSRVRGRHLGTFGLAGAFSFFSNKNLPVGEGGMIVTADGTLAARLRLLRSHGMTTLSWDRHRGHAAGYDVVALGLNYRIDEPRATLARRRLARLDAENAHRARLADGYHRALSDVPAVAPGLPPAGVECAHHLFTVVVDEGVDRDAFRRALAEHGVQTSVHYPPVHRFSIYDDGSRLPLTERYGARTVTLPMFAHMTAAQQARVIEAATTAVVRPDIVRASG